MSEIRDQHVRFYDQSGEEISLEGWASLVQNTSEFLAKDTIDGWRIATRWLGIDFGLGLWSGPPLIFETVVFPAESWQEQYCEHWATEVEALAAHHSVVDMVRRGNPPNDLVLNAERRWHL